MWSCWLISINGCPLYFPLPLTTFIFLPVSFSILLTAGGQAIAQFAAISIGVNEHLGSSLVSRPTIDGCLLHFPFSVLCPQMSGQHIPPAVHLISLCSLIKNSRKVSIIKRFYHIISCLFRV